MTQGPEVAAFEREFAAAVGAPHACAVSSCTTALHLALRGARRRRRRRGGHGQPLLHRHRQRHPLLRRDAGVRGHRAGHVQHRSRAASRPRITPRTKALLCRAPAGHAVRPRRGSSRSRARAACRWSRTRPAPSAARSAGTDEWQRIGRPHGDVACFSFHPRKLLSTGDGGMLTTARRGAGRAVPAAAPARHERARHRAPRVARGGVRGVSGRSASTTA